jgi:2'-hydroxyisoflavone reductase
MNLLILGGTRFVGRHLAAAALAAGHQVTLFNRGRTSPGLFPEAEHLLGDRGGDLSLLKGRRGDAVIDVNGYLPRHVRASAELLTGAADFYLFISTISVYAGFTVPGLDEDAPLLEPGPGDAEAEKIPPGEGYGRLKVLCERTVREVFPDRALIVRPCIVVGPWDGSGRFSWWVERAARGGEMLSPGRPDRPVELIDARDLAAWALRMVERRATGTFNAAGPERTLTMAEMLDTCRRATGGGARFTWVDDGFLEERGVELPFWQPEETEGYDLVDNRRAVSQGLTFRPLADSARDVHAWVAADPGARTPEGLSPEREAGLLEEWRRARQSPPGVGYPG